MKTKLALSTIAAAVAVFSQGAFAQASSPTRAEVKAEAKGVAKMPAGEAGTQTPAPSTMSDKTRAQRKATTKADEKAGKIEEAGEKPSAAPAKTSETTRAERKATTKAAEKAGQIPEAGEKGSQDAGKKP